VEFQSLDEELRQLDLKLSQLKRDYDQYFLGNRPREPALARGEINKTIVRLSNMAIKNTALRFKFSSLCSRFQAFRRQWDDTLRQIDAGTYQRHRFKARLQEQASAGPSDAGCEPGDEKDLYQSYVEARLACGESVKGISRQRLRRVIEAQRAELRARFGDDAEFRFRVSIEDGKVRLKASRSQD